jgi:hypothetical protein
MKQKKAAMRSKKSASQTLESSRVFRDFKSYSLMASTIKLFLLNGGEKW